MEQLQEIKDKWYWRDVINEITTIFKGVETFKKIQVGSGNVLRHYSTFCKVKKKYY